MADGNRGSSFLQATDPRVLHDPLACVVYSHGIDRLDHVSEMTPTLAEFLRRLHAVAYDFKHTNMPLRTAHPQDHVQLMNIVNHFAGTNASYEDLKFAIEQVIEMERELVDEFVTASVKHQYTPDGRMHESDPLTLLMTAFYPEYEFRGERVLRLAWDARIAGMRSWTSMSRILYGIWCLQNRDRMIDFDRRIEGVMAYLEAFVFGPAKHETPDVRQLVEFKQLDPTYIEVDPTRGFVFKRFAMAPGRHTVVRHMWPRRVQTEDFLRDIDTFVVARPKNITGRFRKAIEGRSGADTIGVRITVCNLAEYQMILPKLQRLLYENGRPKIVNGKGANDNKHSIPDPGVLWKGEVSLHDVQLELQVVLFETNWNRQHSLTDALHDVYKSEQWLLPLGPGRPSLIRYFFPRELYPEWADWEFVVESHKHRLLRRGNEDYGSNYRLNQLVLKWVEQETQRMLQTPWEIKRPKKKEE